MGNINGTFVLHAYCLRLLCPPVTYTPARFPWREVNLLVRCALSGEAPVWQRAACRACVNSSRI